MAGKHIQGRLRSNLGLHVETGGTGNGSGVLLSKDLSYFTASPRPKGETPVKFVTRQLRGGARAHTQSSSDVQESMQQTSTTWHQSIILWAIHLLWFLYRPVAKLGETIELMANVLVANGGLLKTIWRFFLSYLFLFQKWFLTVPARDSADYRSFIGLIDPRTALFEERDVDKVMGSPTPSADVGDLQDHTAENDKSSSSTNPATGSRFPDSAHGSRSTGDVLAMAAKLAYENEAVCEKVVRDAWGMHFVKFYNCWNAFQKMRNTQVFVFTDKPTDAKAVVIAWRGTEPFNFYDWSTDIDISWCKLGEMGRVHIGFLEALGLADRSDMTTFDTLRRKSEQQRQLHLTTPKSEVPHVFRPGSGETSGLPQNVIDTEETILAYDDIAALARTLLKKNPDAKLFITGHSLGGALAALFTGMLFQNEETDLLDKIAAVYTFGQPRVGDERFSDFMADRLSTSNIEFYRIVYCNDIVPRVPFDDPVFQFRHWGHCYYFNSLFKSQAIREVPNKNFFSLMDFVVMHLNAAWELVDCFFLKARHGPEFGESIPSVIYRAFGVLVPGLGGHSPVNYVNAMRLGMPSPLQAKISEEIHRIDTADLQDAAELLLTDFVDLYTSIRSTITSKRQLTEETMSDGESVSQLHSGTFPEFEVDRLMIDDTRRRMTVAAYSAQSFLQNIYTENAIAADL